MTLTYTKVRTGVPGFDKMISGGLREGRSIVLCGPSGSGKTTFGLQYLYSGAKDFDEPGVYVTLSQSAKEIHDDSKSFGWDIKDLMEQGKLLVIEARPFKTENGIVTLDESLYRGESVPFEHLTQLILSGIKRVDAKRLVVDSLTVLAMQYSNKFYMRQGMQGLTQALEDNNCTSLLITEHHQHDRIPIEWYVASGIVIMNHIRKEDTMDRTIQVLKLRGVRHDDQIFPIKLENEGLKVLHPKLTT
jgi:circadian clock protein KaiC